MKLKLHGIRFSFWLVFMAVAVGITVFIGILQTGLIGPYFRNTKMNAVTIVADVLQHSLIDENTDASIEQAMKEAFDNDVCAVIYNDAGFPVYRADALGAGCIFDAPAGNADPAVSSSALKASLEENGGELHLNLTNPFTEQEMILYGRLIREPLANYYLYVNSPLEPVDSIVSIFTRQYIMYTLLAILLASVVSLWIARRITKPIVNMQKEAVKLSRADYDVSFDGGSFDETKELANTLNHAAGQLSKIDEMRRDLLANVSHDIRTPLTDIRAYAEMIQDISGDDPGRRQKHLAVIIRETEFMDRLVQDMSELAKMQSGNIRLNRENVDLVPLIYDIAEMDDKMIQEAGLTLVIELPESLIVYADEIQISRVITNYLSNAVKHSPKGKTVTIRGFTKDDGETVRIEVEDQGEGIDESEIPYIWNRYQKSSRSFSRSQTSTGLGLAIVKAIADSHGFAYGVQSKKGEGSLFYMEMVETHES